MAKHKFASISLTVKRDRAISSKFSTHRVSKECNLCHFWQKFSKIPKNGRHFWGFSKFFCQNWQILQICLDLLNLCEIERFRQNRSISHGKEYRSKFVIFAIFGKKISKIPKNGRHFWGFSKIFAKIGKTQICFYLLRYPVRDRAISTKSLYLAQGI